MSTRRRETSLPERHVLALRDKSKKLLRAADGEDPAWVQDYALFFFDADGRIAGWYSGAERIYGYRSKEIAGQPVSCLYPDEDALGVKLKEELKRAAAQGHFGNEGWHIKKDGSRFWANVLTMALRGERRGTAGLCESGARLQQAARQAEEKLRRGGVLRLLSREHAKESTIAGVVSGEFDHITDANDTFLQMVGYSREDLVAGRLYWPDLTPAEYLALDEEAHEEGMRYGACTPFEKEYIRKDGTRVRVLVALAVLNLSPFRWMTIVQVLTGGEEAADGRQ